MFISNLLCYLLLSLTFIFEKIIISLLEELNFQQFFTQGHFLKLTNKSKQTSYLFHCLGTKGSLLYPIGFTLLFKFIGTNIYFIIVIVDMR